MFAIMLNDIHYRSINNFVTKSVQLPECLFVRMCGCEYACMSVSLPASLPFPTSQAWLPTVCRSVFLFVCSHMFPKAFSYNIQTVLYCSRAVFMSQIKPIKLISFFHVKKYTASRYTYVHWRYSYCDKFYSTRLSSI